MSILNQRPAPSEHAPYASTYLDATDAALAAAGTADLLVLLEHQRTAWPALLAHRDAAIVTHAYAPGKWTLGESLVHVADTERVFAYRALRVARGDRTPLPGFDQDAWVPESRVDRRTVGDLLEELDAVRVATLSLVRSLDDVALMQIGTASNNPVSCRALMWMIAGHAAHHLTLTEARYLAP
jgi:hypothetical protein